MQIKRIYRCFTRTTSMMLCCMLTFAACVNEEALPSPGEQEPEMVNLSMEIANRSGVPGSDSEIKKVRIIAFDSRNGALIYNELIDNPSTMPVTIEMLSGTRDFYAITNEPASQTAALADVRSLQHLQAIRIPYNEVEQGTTFVTFGSLPGKVLKPMVTNQIEIENKRLAVKVDLTLNGKNFTPATSVAFSNLPDNIPLFEVPYEPATGNSKKITVTPLTDPGSVPTGYIWSRTATVVLPSYLFTPEGDESKAPRIVVTQGSGEISAPIGHKASTDDYTLKRNHIYSLTAMIGPDELVIESQVKNWTSLPQDYPAGGGSFWKGQPEDARVGLNGTDADATATFTATLNANGTNLIFKWYRVKQKSNTDFTLVTEEVTAGVASNDQTSSLTLKADGLEDACMVYCVASITAPDGKIDRLESNYATFMPVGDWIQPTGTYPDMQNWKAPLNAPLGSTCLLQDTRDDKVYRVKLMADGNWWMIQDLAYGNASSEDSFDLYALRNTVPLKSTALDLKLSLYGLAKESGFSTGGKLYNGHAALQLPGLEADAGNDGKNSLAYTLLQGICPDGWHLPGNIDNFNEEWSNLVNKGMDINAILGFKYNSSTDLNAYTEITSLGADNYMFHGGYLAGKSTLTTPIQYLTLYTGILYGTYTIGKDKGARIDLSLGAPIRCLRNFK